MKTAGELGITETEYSALIEVQAKLAHGDYVWQPYDPCAEFTEWGPAPNLFIMSTIYSKYGCQTAACIGGWMAVHMDYRDRSDAVDYVNNKMSLPLHQLCFPAPGIMNLIQPKHAVKAIDNFLNTGAPMWYDVLKGERVLVPVGESHGTRTMVPRVVDLGGYIDSTESDAIDRSEPLLIEKERT